MGGKFESLTIIYHGLLHMDGYSITKHRMTREMGGAVSMIVKTCRERILENWGKIGRQRETRETW